MWFLSITQLYVVPISKGDISPQNVKGDNLPQIIQLVFVEGFFGYYRNLVLDSGLNLSSSLKFVANWRFWRDVAYGKMSYCLPIFITKLKFFFFTTPQYLGG